MDHPPKQASRRKPSAGFTLIELLVVISIIAVLVALLLPAIGKAREQAFISSCQVNQHQIYIGVRCYHNDFKDYGPVYTNSPDADGAIFSGFIPTTAAVGSSRSSLALVWDGKYMSSSKAFYCPSEIAWSMSKGWADPSAGAWWASVYNYQCTTDWNSPTLAGSRLNSSYIYRWACPNPHGFVTPWFPNVQSRDGQLYAMTFSRDGKNGDMGLMMENTMDHGFSPANVQGTAHFNGGNALFCDGHVKFLRTMVNLYNPGNGPFGYYLGTMAFADQVDHQ